MAYQILTDSCCDFTPEKYRELGLEALPLSVTYRGRTYDDRNDETLKELYDGLRAGEVATTAAVNPARWESAMLPILAAGKDVYIMAFSSGLSTTYQSAVIAAEELAEQYPNRKILVSDTLCASLGQGLLVWYACKKRDEGLSMEQLHDWVEENKLHLCHWFTVNDLMYLKRGGRVSAATALLGTALNIKPILHVDDEGHLINVDKVRGRKTSIAALAEKVAQLGGNYDNRVMFISHGDCLADAQALAEILKTRFGVEEVYINYVGAVIGSHSGPGTLALFFMGDHR